nr:MAG: hypothetical protein [Podoviridae sp. ctka020]
MAEKNTAQNFDWIWMPHAGHFILSYKCRFFLNTYVNGYVISTVGELWNERAVREICAEVRDPIWFSENRSLKGDAFDSAYFKKFGFEDIGYNRKYETIVFKAKKSNEVCCPYEIDVDKEFEMDGYNNAKDAREGHMALCKKYSKK